MKATLVEGIVFVTIDVFVEKGIEKLQLVTHAAGAEMQNDDALTSLVGHVGGDAAIQKLVGAKTRAVLISFTAGAWCPPCMALNALWGTVAREAAAQRTAVEVVDIMCDQNMHVCNGFNVGGYPTVVLYPAGPAGTGAHVYPQGAERTVEAIHKWARAIVGADP